MKSPVPTAVRRVMQRWRLGGQLAQPPVAWRRTRWTKYFPRHKVAFRRAPDLLDRVSLRYACKGAASGAGSAQNAFILIMAWRYGIEVGYGPWRTIRVLSGTDRAPQKLAAVAQTLRNHGAHAAYRRLADNGDCRLRWLGPGFGTKFMYFCQAADQNTTALVLDSLVAAWLRRNTELHFNPVPWSVSTYEQYLNEMHLWASSLECTPDQLEYCIFREMSIERDSQRGKRHTTRGDCILGR